MRNTHHKYLKAFIGSTLGFTLGLATGCQGPTLSYEPVNTTIQTQLPNQNQASNAQMFSFRLIAPPEHVDAFSVLQAAAPAPQRTLPVDQLEEVQVAKEKILNSQYLKPQEATTLAYEVSRIYSWDTELARQIIVEIMDTYMTRRNEEVAKLRAKAEERALYFQQRAALASAELEKQNALVREKLFGDIPNPQPISIEEQNQNRLNYFRYIQARLEKAQKAQEEYNKQAKVVLERWQAEQDRQTQLAREKEEKAQAVRAALFKEILAKQGIESIEPPAPPETPPDAPQPPVAGFNTQSTTTAPVQTYQLTALANGDFLLEAPADLPATLQLKVKDFDLPITVPVMPQTHNGRLLLSVEKDAQGRPLVQGGLDAMTGFQFDLSSPVFTLKYLDNQHQELIFTYPDGHQERFDVARLKTMKYADTQHWQGEQLTLSGTEHAALKQQFAAIRYTFTPELSFMQPDQAADILTGLNL